MGIMIIFLILSIALIIGTIVYLNIKKKKSTNNAKKTTNQHSKSWPKKSLARILEIKINDNIICLGNRYSSVMRLGNIDYNMLSQNEQESIEDILIQTSLSINYPTQFFSTTEYIDTSKVISLIMQNKTKNLKIKEYKKHLIDYLQNLQENKSISIVQNYAIISFDGLYENAIEELNRKTLSLKSNLLRANISCSILDENELYNLVYRELNKNSTLDIGTLKEGGKHLYVGKKQKRKNN